MPGTQPTRGSGEASQRNMTVVSGYVLPKRAGRYEPVQIEGQSIIRQRVTPGIILIAGVIGWVFQIRNHGSLGVLECSGYTLGGIIFSVISLALGLLAMAKMMGAELDTISAMAWKLVSVAVFTGAAASLVASIDREAGNFRGVLVGIHLVLLLYFVCVTSLFKLELLEGLTAAVIALVVQAILILTVAQALPPGAAKLML
ncbi:MAG TPA: hypothetical protein VG722_11505 [Tepidisphaeraceae bacterium]|nr:hypothetical protein [Tepidisphaeraceae bacterium]